LVARDAALGRIERRSRRQQQAYACR